MKFPIKNSKSQNNQSTMKKSVNGKNGLNKGVKNQRNLVQQQRANTLQSGVKGVNKKRFNHEEDIHEDYTNNQNDFDDEVDGMDANANIGRKNGDKRENKQYNQLM